MITSDLHMHTNFSNDSETPPEEMVKGAISKGLKTICFTDHYDKDIYGGGVEEVIDTDRYFKVMEALREKYRDRITILIGIEIGLQPHLGPHYAELVRNRPYDFVVGSVHAIQGKDLYYNKAFFEIHTDEEGYRIILKEMLEDAKAIADFDVMGHIDYMVRYGTHQARDYSYAKFADEIDAILMYLIDHGKGIEMNMSGFKYGLGFCHPHPDIIKRYRELGGEIITVGADAHQPDHIAYDYYKAEDILKDCGFTYYTEFMERRPVFKSL